MNYTRKEFIILLIILITAINSKMYKIDQFEHPLLQNLTEITFDEEIKDDDHTPLIVIFYMHTCPYCKAALEAIIKFSEKNANNNNTNKQMKMGKVECDDNMFFCLRFNVTRVPYIIIIQNKKLYDTSKSLVNEQSIYQFINEERIIFNGKEIPEAIGIISWLFKTFEDAMGYLNRAFDKINKTYFIHYTGIIHWTGNHTVGLLVLGLIIIISLEFLFIYCCCNLSLKKGKKIKEIKEEIKENSNGKQKEVNDKNDESDSEDVDNLNNKQEDTDSKKLKHE